MRISRLRHIIFHLLTLASLLLGAAACVFWARSYRMVEVIVKEGSGNAITIMSYAGGLTYLSIAEIQPSAYVSVPEIPDERRHWNYGRWDSPTSSPLHQSLADPGLRKDWEALGFHWRVSDGYQSPTPMTGSSFSTFTPNFMPSRFLTVPYWFIAGIFGIAPIGRFISWARRRRRIRQRRMRGLCVGCGYDLRATPGRCPECGAGN